MWGLASLLLLFLVIPSYALHESDVGVLDWHKLLIGVPLSGASVTSPVFHTVPGTDASLILTATSNNVLAALNSTDGGVVWRYIYEPDDRIVGFYKHDNLVLTLSGPGGSTLRFFDVLTGHLTVEKTLHPPLTGRLSDPHHFGTHIAFDASSPAVAAYVLTNGHTVTHVDENGEVRWAWSSPDQGSLTMYSHIIPTSDTLYLIGLSKSFAGYTLHLTALDLTTGNVLADQGIPSSIKDFNSYLPLSSFDPSQQTKIPQVLWLEEGALKSLPLLPSLNATISMLRRTEAEANFVRLLDVGLSTRGYVIAIESSGSEHLLALREEGIVGLWELKAGKKDERTSSVWAGGIDSNGSGDLFVSRFYWAYAVRRTRVETFRIGAASPLVNELTMFFQFDTESHGVINHATLSPDSSTSTASVLFTTSTGAVQLWHLDTALIPVTDSDDGSAEDKRRADPQEKWTREESLATVAVAEFVELPEAGLGGDAGSTGAQERFMHRVWRQIGNAKNFPQYLVGFVRRFVLGSPSISTAAITATSESHDAFGFRQVLVLATLHGKIFGLDSSNGRILWSRIFGLGWAEEVGGRIYPVKMFGGFGLGGEEVILVTQRRADNTLVDTVLFHINARTGADASKPFPQSSTHGIIEGVDAVSGPILETFLLDPPNDASLVSTAKSKSKSSPIPNAKAVLLLDEYLQVIVYPDTTETQATLTHYADKLYFPLRGSTEGIAQKRLLGHKISLNDALSDKYVAFPTWTFSLPAGEDVKAIVPAHRASAGNGDGGKGWAASFGKVLGNRTTLYKYLNPRIFVVLSEPLLDGSYGKGKKGRKGTTCGIYVVDAAKGSLIYRAALPAGRGKCDVKVALVENWLVYHYYDGEVGKASGGPGETKGWRVVSVELYEGSGVDDKTSSSDISAYSRGNANVRSFEQSYIFPHAITALAPTFTKFGITSKDLIVATHNHQVQSIPRRLLDPRRPNRKITAEEQEELLISYDPVLAYDPKRVLSHDYEVANIQKIVTSPSLLESTSLVFAHGLDLFLTRVAPSGTFDVLSENFNKVQLVFTVLGLGLAIVITKPMVRRKRLRERWYQH